MLWKQWGTKGDWSGQWELGQGLCVFDSYPVGFPAVLHPAPLDPRIISDLPKLAAFATRHGTTYGEYFTSLSNADITLSLPPLPADPARVFALHHAVQPTPPQDHSAHCTNPMRLMHRQLKLSGKHLFLGR